MSIWRNATTGLLAALCLIGWLPAAALAGDFPTGDPASLGFSAERLKRIDVWFQQRADTRDLAGKDAGDTSGAVIAIARNGGLAYFQAAGYQDRARTVHMTRDSIFWIASMTKPVTSVAAMILVDDGKIELDAPVAKYLPELANMQVASEKADQRNGELVLEPPKRAMTIRDLLRHTSGLVYPPQFLGSPVNKLYERATFRSTNTLEEFVHSLASLPLAHQPGEVWEYSWGVDVLARVVEVASGQPFDKFLASRIFAPLHMVDTGFYVPADKLGRLVDPPEPRETQFDITRPRKLLSGGGGLASTAEDYVRFCQMLLNEGELDGARVLRAETVRLMTSDALPPGIRFALDFVGPSTGSSWGLGFAVRTSAASSNIPGSVGSYSWNGLWGTWFWVDPAEKLVAVMMIQAVPAKSAPYRKVMRSLTYEALLVPRQKTSD